MGWKRFAMKDPRTQIARMTPAEARAFLRRYYEQPTVMAYSVALALKMYPMYHQNKSQKWPTNTASQSL